MNKAKIIGLIATPTDFGEKVLLTDILNFVDTNKYDVEVRAILNVELALPEEKKELNFVDKKIFSFFSSKVPFLEIAPKFKDIIERDYADDLFKPSSTSLLQIQDGEISQCHFILFSNFQYNIFPYFFDFLVRLKKQCGAKLIVVDLNNLLRLERPARDSYISEIDYFLQQRTLNSNLCVPKSVAARCLDYRFSDAEVLETKVLMSPQFAHIMATFKNGRKNICIAVSYWAFEECQTLASATVFERLTHEIDQEFGEYVNFFTIGKHKSSLPGWQKLPDESSFAEISTFLANLDVLISSNVGSHLAARAYQLGVGVVFITPDDESIQEAGFTDLTYNHAGTIRERVVVLLKNQLERVSVSIKELLGQPKHTMAAKFPIGSEVLMRVVDGGNL